MSRSLSFATVFFGWVFVVLGILKLSGIILADSFNQTYLSLANPVFPVFTNRLVLAVGAMIEVGLGWFISRKSQSSFRPLMLVWLCLVILAYRFLLGFVDYEGPCGCLFGINRLLPLSVPLQRALADFLVLGGLATGVLATPWRRCFRQHGHELAVE